MMPDASGIGTILLSPAYPHYILLRKSRKNVSAVIKTGKKQNARDIRDVREDRKHNLARLARRRAATRWIIPRERTVCLNPG